MYRAAMLIGAILGGIIAHNKGRNILFWTVACGLLPLLLLVLLALPRRPKHGEWRPCPFCMAVVPWTATVCAYCRREMPPPHSAPCKYCGAEVWAGHDTCPQCGNPAPWRDDDEKNDKNK